MDVIDIAAIEKTSSEQAERLHYHRVELESALASFSAYLMRWLEVHWVPGVLTIKEYIMRADGFEQPEAGHVWCNAITVEVASYIDGEKLTHTSELVRGKRTVCDRSNWYNWPQLYYTNSLSIQKICNAVARRLLIRLIDEAFAKADKRRLKEKLDYWVGDDDGKPLGLPLPGRIRY